MSESTVSSVGSSAISWRFCSSCAISHSGLSSTKRSLSTLSSSMHVSTLSVYDMTTKYMPRLSTRPSSSSPYMFWAGSAYTCRAPLYITLPSSSSPAGSARVAVSRSYPSTLSVPSAIYSSSGSASSCTMKEVSVSSFTRYTSPSHEARRVISTCGP